MNLPSLQTPSLSLFLPIAQRDIRYRPFLVREEKMIILALTEESESKKASSMLDAAIDITQNCILTPDVFVKDLAIADFEWLFLHIRMASKGESVLLNIPCRHTILGHPDDINPEKKCDNSCKVSVDLRECEVTGNTDKIIDLGQNVSVVMKFPTLGRLSELSKNNEKPVDLQVIYESLDMITVGEDVYDNFTYEEFDTFMDQFTSVSLGMIRDWFLTLPTITQTIKYVCNKCESDNEITLRGSSDFFVSLSETSMR